MGCNCGGGRVKEPTYTHTDKNGKTQAYKSKAEAERAVLRSGGSYTVSK
jgi:hypothetical protein